MKTDTYNLTFLTPCFCAGADPKRAEIRPSAIRGQLRWWFRCLGGSRDDEREIFGGVADSAEKTKSSAVVIRISGIEFAAADWNPPKVDPNAPSSYVWYFASVSGKPSETKETITPVGQGVVNPISHRSGKKPSGTKATGPRWTKDGAIAPETRCKLTILYRRDVSAKFHKALKTFLALGSIGLRATRGLGAFNCAEQTFNDEIQRILKEAGFQVVKRDNSYSMWNDVIKEIGSLVKGSRKEWRMKSTSPSPFGCSTPRQTSAIWFRPIKDVNSFKLVVFEAPQKRVLEEQSRKNLDLSKLRHAKVNAGRRQY
jgi:CRISPR/Cas system CMR-associated protein Cmr1 (group 7 of RAMP superfamily)